MCKGMAPLPCLANRRGRAGSCATGASCCRLLALGASPQHMFMRVSRVSQSNRHGNRKGCYSKGLQHRFFLPGRTVKKPPNVVARFATRYAALLHGTRQGLFKANYGVVDFDLNQGGQTRRCYRSRPNRLPIPVPRPGFLTIAITYTVACENARLQPETN
jgi:hypothetical protein